MKKSLKWLALALVALQVMLLLAAPVKTASAEDEGHYPVTISTYNYAKEPIEVTFEKRPEKVVCTNQTQTEMLLFLVTHFYIMHLREEQMMTDIPQILTNPIFIAIILTVLAAGSYLFERWLDQLHPTAPAPITFTSGRKSVTLRVEEILYVESNDDATVVYATAGRSFRNITPISRWEAILKPHFIRIHRSYLVNKDAVSGVDVDILYVGDTQLPISRKYRETVQGLYS